MTRRISNKLNNGMDRDGFTVGVTLDWSQLFLAGLAVLFLVLALVVGIAIGVGVLCDS